jgi:hypothetical protein
MRRVDVVFVGLTLVACGGSATASSNDGGAGDATDDAPTAAAVATGAVATLGSACASPAALGCAGNAQKVTLICSSGTWKENGTCPAGQNCDSAQGPNQGTCAPIVGDCASASPGEVVCASAPTAVVRCGPDLVSETTVDGGTCTGTCSPGAMSCASDTQLQTCGASGTWGGPTPCPTGASCHTGACACPSGASVCNGACVNEQTDVTNCGACGARCQAPATACTNGQCTCPCSAATAGTACANASCVVSWGQYATCGTTPGGPIGCCPYPHPC